jgi:hypothetical protein
VNYRVIPFAHKTGLGALTQGNADMTQKITLRPKAGAAPGFPGFFGWLAATHPDLYSIALAKLPAQVSNWTTGIGAPGAHLSGIYGHGGNLAGLGDDPNITPIAPVDLSQLFTISTQASTEGATDSTPAPTTSFSDTIANTIKTLANGILPILGQQKILNVQLDRAQKGLPPLDTTGYVDNTGLNVGLTSSTQKTFLMIAGIAGAALLAHSFLKRSR